MTPWIGTSGFQYPEWRGTFYPEKFPTTKMLPFYAERFSTSEINYTFYRIPNSKTIEGWDTSTPEHFRFGLKHPYCQAPGLRGALGYFPARSFRVGFKAWTRFVPAAAKL